MLTTNKKISLHDEIHIEPLHMLEYYLLDLPNPIKINVVLGLLDLTGFQAPADFSLICSFSLEFSGFPTPAWIVWSYAFSFLCIFYDLHLQRTA